MDMVVDQRHLPCGLEASHPHSKCGGMLHREGTPTLDFPKESVRRTDTPGGSLQWVAGMTKRFEHAYSNGELTDLKGP
jgi:hypothetical protein